MSAINVRASDAGPVFASQDLGTTNFAVRHFIDRKYPASVDAEGLLDSLVEPTPPCKQVWGTRCDSDAVVGMLPKCLTVTIYTGIERGWVQTKAADSDAESTVVDALSMVALVTFSLEMLEVVDQLATLCSSACTCSRTCSWHIPSSAFVKGSCSRSRLANSCRCSLVT